jgi:hypothetical protein
MDAWQIALIAGLSGGIAAIITQMRGKKAAVDILPLLQQRGAMTIPEIMTALRLSGFSAQGKVVSALGQLVSAKQVEELPLPEGTRQLEKIKVRRYQARA